MRRRLFACAILVSAAVPLTACGSGSSGGGTAGTGGGGGFATGGSGGSGAQSSGGDAGQAGSGGVGGGGAGGGAGGSGGSASNGWTVEFESSELWQNGYSDCEINGFVVEAFALDPNKPNRMAAVMTCSKNWVKSQLLLDFDLDTKQLLTKELLLDDVFLGITVTKAGRAAVIYRSQAIATNPRVTVAYHDSGAADWQVVTRDYSPFDGYANSMTTDGERVMLAGRGAIYDISKLDTPSSWTRHSHDIPSNSAGGAHIEWMVIDAGQATQALLATSPSSGLAVYRCTLPTTPAGKVICQSKPTNQGFAGAPYFQWEDVYSHGFATVWARSGKKPTPWATSDEGKTFSDLTLPSPCQEAATTHSFAGDPKSAKTFVIAQSGGVSRLFATHDSGASYVEVPSSGGSIAGIAIGSDGSLVQAHGGKVLRRSSF